MTESEKFPYIDKNQFNKKAFKKGYRIKYESFIYKCKISKSKSQESKYRSDIKEIMTLVENILNKDITYQIGNIYYILALLEHTLEFMSNMSKRVQTVNTQSLNLVYDAIDEQVEILKNNLKNNLESPIPLSELRKALEE